MKDDDFTELMRERWTGFTGFSIKARDTEANKAIHAAFKDFCSVESNGDFTIGIKILLEYIQSDAKYENLNERLAVLEAKFDQLTRAPQKEQDTGAF